MSDFYKNLISEVDAFTSEKKKCCKRGCDYCCYQIIEVSDFEVESILDGLDNLDDDTIFTIEMNLFTWFDFFDDNTSNIRPLNFRDIMKFWDLPFTPQLKCPLLINHECAIYENRPIACRIHYVKDLPNLCKKEPYRNSDSEAAAKRYEVAKAFLRESKNKVCLTPLTYILAEYLEIDRKLKRFIKIPLIKYKSK